MSENRIAAERKVMPMPDPNSIPNALTPDPSARRGSEGEKAGLPSICCKCGQRLERLMVLALLVDMGCSASPGPLLCPKDGGEHEFG